MRSWCATGGTGRLTPCRPAVPAYPLSLTVLLALPLSQAWRRPWARSVTVVVCASQAFASWGLSWPKETLANEFRVSIHGRRMADVLERTFEPWRPSVGVITTGGFGYSYDGPTIDLLGLNNEAMAHASRAKVGIKNHAGFDRDVFFRQKPDLLLTDVVFIHPRRSDARARPGPPPLRAERPPRGCWTSLSSGQCTHRCPCGGRPPLACQPPASPSGYAGTAFRRSSGDQRSKS